MQLSYEEIKTLSGLIYKQQCELIELGAENLQLKAELRQAKEQQLSTNAKKDS